MNEYVWFSLEGAIAYIGGDVHPQTVRRWVREGKLKASRPTPRTMRFRSDWLDAFLAGETAASVAPSQHRATAGRGRVVSIMDRRR